MLGASRRLGQLLLKRSSASATGSSAQTVPVSGIEFLTQLNTQERHRVDDKLEDQRKFVDDKFERVLKEFSSSQQSLRSDVASLRTDVASLKDLKAAIHSLDKKVTLIIAIPSILVTFVTLAGNRFGLLGGSAAPVVAKSVEVVASTPWYIFW